MVYYEQISRLAIITHDSYSIRNKKIINRFHESLEFVSKLVECRHPLEGAELIVSPNKVSYELKIKGDA